MAEEGNTNDCNGQSGSHSSDQLLANFDAVKERLVQATARRSTSNNFTLTPRLVCVGKTKPASTIQTLYDAGQRNFGENYVNEIVEKSHSLQSACPDVRWHFIGHLQTNKVNKLLGCPNLFMLETIDSAKLADKVDKVWSTVVSGAGSSPLKVMVQVNTSNEQQKSGVLATDVCQVVEHIRESCNHLEFCGLMTIGSFNHDYSQGPNTDFVALLQCKEEVMARFSLPTDEVEISMGMSNDFEQAVEMGSSSVRVGSTIFGAREKKQS